MGEQLHAGLSDTEFASAAEAERFVQGFIEQANRSPVAEFDGLAPMQMSALLDAPFDASDILVFAKAPPAPTDTPVMTL